ncbi:MAG: hypothetical protein R2705_14355 [Ilumatobacteraceae bacterium]
MTPTSTGPDLHRSDHPARLASRTPGELGRRGRGRVPDVPDPKLVGWYRSSATPGSPLAPRCWRATSTTTGSRARLPVLEDLDVGAEITVMLDSATSQRFVVTEVALFDKDELPRADLEHRPAVIRRWCSSRAADTTPRLAATRTTSSPSSEPPGAGTGSDPLQRIERSIRASRRFAYTRSRYSPP